MRFPSLLHDDPAAHGKETMENAAALTADLNLSRIFAAMAQGDPFIRQVAREVLLSRERPTTETIRFRQAILGDFLRNPSVCQGLYEALSTGIGCYEAYLSQSLPSFSTFITASAVIKDRIALSRILFGCIRKVRDIMDRDGSLFDSSGVRACFQAFLAFFAADFLPGALEFLGGIETACENMYVRIGAGLGLGLKGDGYVLQSITDEKGKKNGVHSPGKGAEIGLTSIGIQAQAGKLRDAALSQLSHGLKQVNESTLAGLKALRYEMGFYLGDINLHGKLQAIGVPVCFPCPEATDEKRLEFKGLVDIGLAIENSRRPAGNSFAFHTCRMLLVTGANQGGKSTFLRSFGCAQIMMQCGLFVAAEAFRAGCRSRIFTHFCRAESAKADQGRLNEELGRMNEIVEHIDRDSLVLMNESFSTTSEREASAIAQEVLRAFYDLGIQAVYVTHFYEFARVMEEQAPGGVHFLVAGRNPDGTRPYTLRQASPEHTSFGLDIYNEVFGY